MYALLSFSIQPLEEHPPEVLTIIPVLDGTPLTELVGNFEREQGFESAGGYGGLVPEFFQYGPLDCYFLGDSDDPLFDSNGYYLLGCTCGEVGCWPLTARISKASEEIVWDQFKQKYRPDRDYSSFGPFTFVTEQYRLAVEKVATQFRGSQRD